MSRSFPSLSRPIAVGCLLLLLVLGSCRQDENERCQVNDDCSSGLVCCIVRDDPEQLLIGGICAPEERCESLIVDRDAGLQDQDGAAADAGTAADSGPGADAALLKDASLTTDGAASSDSALDAAAASDAASTPQDAALPIPDVSSGT